MGIGETDWLAQEYKREGRPITPQAAARLAREHMLDCDARGLRLRHGLECDARKLKRDTRRQVRRESRPPWPASARSKKLTWTGRPVSLMEQLRMFWQFLTK